MRIFEALNETSNKAVDYGRDYVETSSDYYKLKAFLIFTQSLSYVSKLIIFGSLLFLGIVFTTVAVAIWLGNILGSIVYACFIISGALFIITGIGYLIRKKIDTYIIKKTSKEFFD